MRQLLRPGELACILIGDLEGEEYSDHRHATEWQIDIKAPSPRYIGGKATTNQRTRYRSDPHDGAHKALYSWTFCQRNSVDNGHNLGTPVSSRGQ